MRKPKRSGGTRTVMIPANVYRKLAAKAKRAGLTIPEFLHELARQELAKSATVQRG